jgi:hypothetical protein
VGRDLFGAKLEGTDNERVIALRDQMHFGTSLKEGDRPADTEDLSRLIVLTGASDFWIKAAARERLEIQGNPTLIIGGLRGETATSQENPNRPDERQCAAETQPNRRDPKATRPRGHK